MGTILPQWGKRPGRRVDPLVNTGRPSNLAAGDWRGSWGELAPGFHDYPERDSVAPDIRQYIFPSGQGRKWQGQQLLNGVSQLDSHMMVPRRVVYRDKRGKVISGLAPLPYWQGPRPATNPDQLQRAGGAASQAPGATQTQAWHDATYAGVPSTGGATGGPGTVSAIASLRHRMGF